jgi:D-alanine transaminase
MNEVVFLNGKLVAKSEAFVSPEDRGFNFADGVYEVVKYYRGKPFRFNDHLARLKRSLHEVRIELEDLEQFEGIFHNLLEQNGLAGEEAGVYLQITRGSHQRIHRFPLNIKPTVYAWAFPFSSKPDQLDHGVKVITADDIRWLRCDIKSIALLPNVLYAQKAEENGSAEVIFIRNGVVTEASHSNVIGVKNGALVTHPDSNLILPGITKKVVKEICQSNGIRFIEEGIQASVLHELDEMILVGTGSEITPVVNIDGFVVGDGQPGSLTRFIQEKFFEQTRLL